MNAGYSTPAGEIAARPRSLQARLTADGRELLTSAPEKLYELD